MNRSSLYSQKGEDIPEYKIIILGLTATGKTALLTRYQHNFYDDSGVTTLSIDFNIKKRPKAWYYYYDTCGQQVYRAIISHYYKGSDACIIVYDVSQPKTSQEIGYYYNQVKQLIPDALVYIVGCKKDLPKKVQDDQITLKYKGVRHFLTSAKTDQGVQQLFAQIEQDLLKLKPKTQNSKKTNIFEPKLTEGSSNNGGRKTHKNQCCTN